MDRESGVYYILNTVNNKIYIGQSTHISARWETHLAQLRAGSHPNKALQQDWRDYSESAFEFNVLVHTSGHWAALGLSLTELESIFMRVYQSRKPLFGYNRPDGPRKAPTKLSVLELEANAAAIKYRPR